MDHFAVLDLRKKGGFLPQICLISCGSTQWENLLDVLKNTDFKLAASSVKLSQPSKEIMSSFLWGSNDSIYSSNPCCLLRKRSEGEIHLYLPLKGRVSLPAAPAQAQVCAREYRRLMESGCLLINTLHHAACVYFGKHKPPPGAAAN